MPQPRQATAIDHNVPGIAADCACATGHVYADPAWLARIGTPAAISIG